LPSLRTPKHLVDLYQQSKNKGQHESHFITEPEAQKRDTTVIDANDEDVHLDGSEDLLDDIDIYGDLQ
jgi:hypothetical protein